MLLRDDMISDVHDPVEIRVEAKVSAVQMGWRRGLDGIEIPPLDPAVRIDVADEFAVSE